MTARRRRRIEEEDEEGDDLPVAPGDFILTGERGNCWGKKREKRDADVERQPISRIFFLFAKILLIVQATSQPSIKAPFFSVKSALFPPSPREAGGGREEDMPRVSAVRGQRWAEEGRKERGRRSHISEEGDEKKTSSLFVSLPKNKIFFLARRMCKEKGLILIRILRNFCFFFLAGKRKTSTTFAY